MSLIDIEKELAEQLKKYYENAEYYAKIIKEKAKEIFKDKLLKVILFGSVVEKRWIPLKSDIDIIIVVDIPSEITRDCMWRAKHVCKILDDLNLPYIFQIHILSKEDYKLFEKMIKGIEI